MFVRNKNLGHGQEAGRRRGHWRRERCQIAIRAENQGCHLTVRKILPRSIVYSGHIVNRRNR